MRPAEVLDAQIDLTDRLVYSPLFGDWIDHWAHAEVTRRTTSDESGLAYPLAGQLSAHLRLAYPYRVTAEMNDLITFTAAQLDGTDKFLVDLAPTPAGFVAFDVPLALIDAEGRTMLVHYLTWGPGGGQMPSGRIHKGLAVTTFNDVWRKPDEVQEFMRAEWEERGFGERAEAFTRAAGRWAPVGFDMVFDEMRVGPALLGPSPERAAEIVANGGTPSYEGQNMTRLLLGLFMLLNQTIVAVEKEEADRPGRRRAAKAKIPPAVSVIRLRRTESMGRAKEGESQIEWQRRWIVRQHWRWQPYGPRSKVEHEHVYADAEVEQGGLVRRCRVEGCTNYLSRILIPWAIKGPADLPLAITDRVYSLDR